MRGIWWLLVISAFFLAVCLGCEDEDDPTCDSAVDNAYSNADVITLCDTGYHYGGWSYETYQDCLLQTKGELDEDAIKDDLVDWCEDEWSDDDIKCHNDAENDSDVRDCADLSSSSDGSEYW